MRFFEITSGIRLPVSGEEQTLIDMAMSGDLVKSNLDERSQEVARRMVGRGLLNRSRDADNNIIFKPNKESIRRI